MKPCIPRDERYCLASDVDGLLSVEAMRKMSDLLTPNDVCAELLALSVVEHSYTRGLTIRFNIGRFGGWISDTGRGMRLKPDANDTVSHAERALTSCYPCHPSNSETEFVLNELVWGDRKSLGPALANFACSSFSFFSRREGEIWLQRYRQGCPLSSATLIGQTRASGTSIFFRTFGSIDLVAFRDLTDSICDRIPDLKISGRVL